MKKIFNFIKNNVFLIFAAYWFIDFVIGLITFNPSTLDATTRKIKALEFGMDLLWTLVFMLEHTVTKVGKALDKRIDWVHEEVKIIYTAINEAVKEMESKEESAEEEEKSVEQK